MRLPTVSVIQRTCAGPHGSIAKGIVKENAVGKYIYRVTIWRTFAVSNGRSSSLPDRCAVPRFRCTGHHVESGIVRGSKAL